MSLNKVGVLETRGASVVVRRWFIQIEVIIINGKRCSNTDGRAIRIKLVGQTLHSDRGSWSFF